MTTAQSEEKTRLASCLDSIERNASLLSARLNDATREIKDANTYMWEARRDLDRIDKAAMHQVIEQKMRSADIIRGQLKKLGKLRHSPYFGRFDFARIGAEASEAGAYYVGVHDFCDEETGKTLVHDWRAPVSSMFYDYEIGPARYQAPSGEIEGRLDRKRQFRIRGGRMEFMLESSVNIVDDVLQEQLSQSSDEGMKNIVATIQRDQNAIIRDADAHTLIIQGVAGSGKTSIALHRIAFLLYRFKDTLKSEDVLIISPNRVFADYIGNVLPELGEEQVAEIGMEKLADDLLQGKVRFQTFFEQTARLLEKNEEELKERIAVKASVEFLKQIDGYADQLEAGGFEAAEWRSGRLIVPGWHFAEIWPRFRGRPETERVAEVMSATEHKIFQHYRRELQPEERRSLRQAIRGMVRRKGLRVAYKGLFEWIGRPELFKPAGGKLEYADVFPLVYLKMLLEGTDNPYKDIKHLLVDEMQDYSPVQYAVLAKLFSCRKTILGDATQSVNPVGGSTAETIQEALRAPAPVKLTKSYRSSWEIMQFALGISPNAELEPLKRHGASPQIVTSKTRAEMIDGIFIEIEDFRNSPHRSLAIIAKTQRQAEKLHADLKAAGAEARLIDAQSAGFSAGVVICTAHMAKGLEFDRVIVTEADAKNYASEIDRNLLYVACTRAMHRLTVVLSGKGSGFLPGPQQN